MSGHEVGVDRETSRGCIMAANALGVTFAAFIRAALRRAVLAVLNDPRHYGQDIAVIDREASRVISAVEARAESAFLARERERMRRMRPARGTWARLRARGHPGLRRRVKPRRDPG